MSAWPGKNSKNLAMTPSGTKIRRYAYLRYRSAGWRMLTRRSYQISSLHPLVCLSHLRPDSGLIVDFFTGHAGGVYVVIYRIAIFSVDLLGLGTSLISYGTLVIFNASFRTNAR